jgi:GDP-L-fucose synthase
MNKNSKIFLAGHNGMVGKSFLKELKREKFKNIYTADKKKLNLISQNQVDKYISKNKFDVVICAAARVGGIYANMTKPSEFIYENIMINNNLINAAQRNNIRKFLFLGSSCIYPKKTSQPIKEEYLLSDYLEPTNLPYAISKIAGIVFCQSLNQQFKNKTKYYCVMPTNLYGEGDNFHTQFSHVIPGLISRMHDAKIKKKSIFKVWGTGKAKRDFLYVDDLTKFCIQYLKSSKPKYDLINVGSGQEISIKELVKVIAKVIGFNKKIVFDRKMPDGHKRKFLDIKKSKSLGFKRNILLPEGIKRTYNYFLKSKSTN